MDVYCQCISLKAFGILFPYSKLVCVCINYSKHTIFEYVIKNITFFVWETLNNINIALSYYVTFPQDDLILCLIFSQLLQTAVRWPNVEVIMWRVHFKACLHQES